MSGRKQNHMPNPSNAPLETSPAPANWPAEFVPLRSAVLTAICVGGWGLILGMLATGNSLLGLKQACMILAGARLEPMLMLESLHSMDIAAVLFAFVLILGAGYIHVSLGLAVLLAIRPWLDGYVYEMDNFYFLWAAMMLLGIWALRQWAAPKPIWGMAPLGLLALLWGISAIGAVTAYQLDTTFRELLFWVYYAAIFFLAANATEGRAARNIVLVGFFAGMAGQALYAYPYLACLLPWMRQEMASDPRKLGAFFQGVTEFTPEIARRFNMNRASASMVYPNALAALLILGLPGCLALALTGWSGLKMKARKAAPVTAFRYSVPAGLALFAIIALVVFMMGQLAITYALQGQSPWFGGQEELVALSVGLAAVSAVAFLLCARQQGMLRAGQWLGALSATLLFPTMLGALWITYSRGAMLALIAACVATALVASAGPPWRVRMRALLGRPRIATGAVALLLVLGLLLTLAGVALAPEALAQETVSAPAPTVTGEGIDVSLADLANPASFRLRLSYWRVALSMAADNWLTGVGLGNFKFAYPIYQYLGAGDVQNAHNGVLQAWCETGIFGVMALVGFWALLFWTGVRAVHRVAGPNDRLLVLGLLAGLVAFFLHALLDMNLTHPTLVTFAMVAAGLLVRAAGRTAHTGNLRGNVRLLCVALLAVAVLTSGFALRPYLQHIGLNGGKFLGVDSQKMLNRRYDAGDFLLRECAQWARAGKEGPAPAIPIQDLVSLLADRTQLFAMGRLLILDPASGKYMRVREDGPLPPDAVFQVVRPWDAHDVGFDRVADWVGELERLDARSPYNPGLALLISRGYKLMAEQAGKLQMDQRETFRARMQFWGEEAVRRSPERADLHQFLGWVNWTSGSLTQGRDSLGYFEAALASFARCTALAPNEPQYQFAYGQTLSALGQSYENVGQPEQAAKYRAQGEAAQAAGEALQARRWALGLP